VTISSEDTNLVKSVDNISKVAVLPVSQLNAGDICNHRKMLFTKEALLSVLEKDQASEN
jgi:ribosomal protein L4